MKNFNSFFNQLTAMPKRLAMVLTVLFTLGVGSMWGATTKTISSFSATSGTIGDVTYTAYKGGGTSAPAVNSNAIRLYQNSSGATGGYIVLSVPEGYKITSATIKSTMATTTGYYIASNPGNSTPAKANFVVSNKSLSANTEYTVSGLSTQYITFACFGTTDKARLYLSYLSVTYESPAQSYNVVLYRNNEQETINNVAAGTSLDDIDGTGEQGGCAEWSFVGWSKSPRSDQDDSTPMDPVTEVDGAGPYYAVYSHTADGGGGSTTKTMTTFTSTSGNIGGDANVSYAAAQGNASTAPAVNDEEIRIYQNGGTLTITGNNGKKLTSITIGSSMKTSVSYKIDGGSESSTQSITAGGKYTLSDIEATSVLFTCKGTDKNSRLYLNHLSVTYSGGQTVYYTTTPDCEPQTPTYTITWKNADGTILETDNDVESGATPQYDGATPTKAATDQYTYMFAGWDPEISTVTGDQTYTAKFTETLRTYTITWKNGDNVLKTDNNVEYGATPQYNGATPTKAATAQYTYAFIGWDPEISTVTGNQTYTAQFSQTVNKYTITWKNADGTTLKTEEVAYGTTPSYTGTTPTKSATDQYTYTHNGWTPSVVAVTGNSEYTATFAETPRTYTITLNTNGGTINAGNVTSYTYGTGATLPTNVTKEHHQFGGWFDNSGCTGTAVTTISTTATGNKEYWAKWTELPKYTVTWSVDGNTTTEEVYSGDKATKAPTIDENNLPCDGADKFVGWTTGEYQGDSKPRTLYPTAADIPAITGDITFYAVFADYED